MSVFERISPYHYNTRCQTPYFSAFYVCPLKFIFPLVLKILMSIQYEYYGICVENTYMPVVLGVA